jgi:hypothetical protein
MGAGGMKLILEFLACASIFGACWLTLTAAWVLQ